MSEFQMNSVECGTYDDDDIMNIWMLHHWLFNSNFEVGNCSMLRRNKTGNKRDYVLILKLLILIKDFSLEAAGVGKREWERERERE